MEITNEDIATVEQLHDLLLDGHDYPLNHPFLKRARELTRRMYLKVELKKQNK